jgi:predicted membrane channel-forming protein YqfA (hemolysin III family)
VIHITRVVVVQKSTIFFINIFRLYSLFWWTNETLNAWTHLLGWMYFAYFTVKEVVQTFSDGESISWHDNLMMIMILVCFQVY